MLRVVSQYVPFVNASIQGFSANYKALQRNPRQYITKFLLFAAAKAAIMGLIALFGKDKLEEYRALPAYQRDLSVNIPLPWADGWLSIPVGFEAASAATGIERGIDYAMGNKDAYLGYFTPADSTSDENAIMQVFNGSLLQSFLPVKPEALLGLGGVPGELNEIRSNYDTFRQRNIVPYFESKVPVARRKGAESASRAGKAMAEILRTDPRVVDHFIQGVGGGAGMIVTTLSDIGRKDKPVSPTRVLGMATGLFKEGPGYGAPQVQRALTTLERSQAQDPRALERAKMAMRAAKTPLQLEAAKKALRLAAGQPIIPAKANLADAKRDSIEERIKGMNAARERKGLLPMSPDQEQKARDGIQGAFASSETLNGLRADTKGAATERIAAQMKAQAEAAKARREGGR
jgi:hypothetical protein